MSAAFVAVFLAIQFTVPLIMLAARGGGMDQPPSGELPLSWQMYTVVPPLGDLVITKTDGSKLTVDAVDALGVIGSRVAYDPDMLRAGCALDAHAASVALTVVGRERTAKC